MSRLSNGTSTSGQIDAEHEQRDREPPSEPLRIHPLTDYLAPNMPVKAVPMTTRQSRTVEVLRRPTLVRTRASLGATRDRVAIANGSKLLF